MVRHMVAGIRRFGVYPMYIHQRDNWEFFAVLRGKCGALLSETGPANLQQHHLWIFPPETAHGWKGDARTAARLSPSTSARSRHCLRKSPTNAASWIVR